MAPFWKWSGSFSRTPYETFLTARIQRRRVSFSNETVIADGQAPCTRRTGENAP
jgi:hypothetical protein